MKKLFMLLAASLAVATASAQIHDKNHTGADRIWFGVSYTPKFLLGESVQSKGVVSGPDKSTVHNYAVEAGYMLFPRLSLGAGIGYERYWIGTMGAVDMLPLYLHTSYFYGKRRGGLFNYARMGAVISVDANARTGFTGGAGVGYRLFFGRRLGVDFKLGYDYTGASVNRSPWAEGGFKGTDWSRHSLSLGVGLVF